MSWIANVLTLFPEMFPGPLAYSLAGKGLKNGVWSLIATNIRDFACDKHRTVDDTCYGHNAGLLLKPDVVHAALTHVTQKCDLPILFMNPRGQPLTQSKVRELAGLEGVTLLCGRYEGVDERVLDYWRENHHLQDVSIGDYIVSGGEMAALTLIDCCVRLLPTIVGNEESLTVESFELDLLEFPQYTKPYDWIGRRVPDVLLSGNHQEIEKWQRFQAEEVTKKNRPDLWSLYLTKQKT
jgi:tRNA (guanine37-N1)-methyltransferase